MICHVCKADAIGQCKHCMKFYCGDHGDVYCVVCRDAAASGDAASAGAAGGLVFDAAESAPEPTGPKCYLCKTPAIGSCGKCGCFCCGKHLAGTHMFDPTPRNLCTECYSEKTTYTIVGCVIGAVILGVMLLFAISSMNR